jgi:uncharacterized protein YbaA (DUF1428 family)
MAYIDVFCGPVANADKDVYITYAKTMEAMALRAGALSVTACWGSSFPDGRPTSFQMAVKARPDETVVTRMVKWESEEARNAGWAEMMKPTDPPTEPPKMPFDHARVMMGGFEILSEG